MKYLITILILLLPLQVMATRLENIIKTGTENYSSKPNRAFIDGLYLEFHGRKATDREEDRFKDMSIQDSSNIIAGRVIIKPPKSKKPKEVKKQVKENIKRYENWIQIHGTPTQEQKDMILDYGTRYKAKSKINTTVHYKIPDEFISKIDKSKQDFIKQRGQGITGLYDWPSNQMFIRPILRKGQFEKDFTHELGHNFDNDYGFNKQDNLFNQRIQAENTNPQDPNYRLENTANHFREYARNGKEYQKKYSKEYDYFEKILKQIPDEYVY